MANTNTDGAVVLGIAEMNRRIMNLLRASVPETANAAVQVAKKHIVPQAMDNCPVKTGLLKSTGRVGDPVMKGYNVEVPVFFGEGTTYGGFVHEDLEAHHDRGGAKYLERALNEEEPLYATHLAQEVRLDRMV